MSNWADFRIFLLRVSRVGNMETINGHYVGDQCSSCLHFCKNGGYFFCQCSSFLSGVFISLHGRCVTWSRG